MNDIFKTFITDLNSSIKTNYKSIEWIFNTEYGYPEFDPLRDEVCKCIICDLHQAAITLTNHLLETSLKKCLIYKHTIQNNKRKDLKISQLFQEGIKKYDNKKSDLSKSINSACSNGLITKDQKKLLHQYRDSFRNSYSHASSEKLFKDVKIKGKEISSVEEIFSDTNEILNVIDIPIIQGIVQCELAKKESLGYLKNIDNIIRQMISKLKTIKNENNNT